MIFMGNPVTLHSFKKGYEDDPLSPPAGEAACGDHPLDPISTFLPSLQRISRQTPEEAIAFFMNASTGAEAKGAAAQKSVRTIFP